MLSPPPISVLIRSFNEADRISRTLEAIQPLGSEIVVIDSGSTDGTREVAEKAGARVVVHPWEGFGPQRRFGEDQCKYDWIFYIDADEVPTTALIDEIHALFACGKEPPHAAYEIRNTMVLPGNLRPAWLADYRMVTRLTDRRHARVTMDPAWDKVENAPGRTLGTLRGRQWHYCFRNWAHAVGKIQYTSTLAAETQSHKPLWLLRLRVLMEFPFEFLKFYLVRRFIFGGTKGFAFSMIQAFSRFVRILKMHELATRRGNDRTTP